MPDLIGFAPPVEVERSDDSPFVNRFTTPIGLLTRTKPLKPDSKIVSYGSIKFDMVSSCSVPVFPLRHTPLETMDVNK